jgi:hypothetical protein
MEGAKIGSNTSAGHPTLKTIIHQGILKNVGVTIFGARSRSVFNSSIILFFRSLNLLLAYQMFN